MAGCLSSRGSSFDDLGVGLASGLCPGNNESAGKRRSGKSPIHKNHLKTIMVEVGRY